jgi:hypothetical protein
MSQSGYAALRSGAVPDARYLAIAAANRGPIVTSHGHNDVFALDVQALGTRFIGEMGCAPYGDSPGRQYDEKTEAHSTLAIDGMEQAPIANEWRWQGHALPVVRRWISTATHDFFHGVHEGFYRYPDHQTLHARKILFIKSAPSYWLIFDWVESNVINDLSVYFHGCVPGRINGTTLLLGEAQGPRLAVFPPAQDAVSAETVASEGLAAYVAENKLDPAHYPCFAYRKRTASDCLVWALVPLADGQQAPVMVRVPVSLNGRPAAPHEVAACMPASTGRRRQNRGSPIRSCRRFKDVDATWACIWASSPTASIRCTGTAPARKSTSTATRPIPVSGGHHSTISAAPPGPMTRATCTATAACCSRAIFPSAAVISAFISTTAAIRSISAIPAP